MAEPPPRGERRTGMTGIFRESDDWRLEKAADLFMRGEQRLDFAAECFVIAAGLVEEGCPPLDRSLVGGLEYALDLRPLFRRHWRAPVDHLAQQI